MSRFLAIFVLLIAPVAARAEPITQSPWLELSVGNKLLHRELTFVDDLFHALPSYALPIGSMPTVSAELWPGGVFVKDGIARDFGLFASFGELVGVQTVVENSLAPPRNTYATDLELSALGRVALGPATFTLAAGYVFHRFAFDPPADEDDAVVPNLGVQALRTGLRVRVRVADPLELELAGAYRFLLGTSPFGVDAEGAEYFPRATGGGADGSVGLLVGLPGGFELRLQGEWKRWFFSLNPEVGDPYVAGGALDESFSARFAVAYRR